MKFISLQFLFICLFGVSDVVAKSEYQFSISTGYSNHDYEGKDEGRLIFGSVGGYFKAVDLTQEQPIDEAGFWQRKPSLFATIGSFDRKKMNRVMGGRILKRFEYDSAILSLRLSSKGVPLWLGWQEIYRKNEVLTFLGEGEDDTTSPESDSSRSYTAGLFLLDTLNADISYYKNDNYRVYTFNTDYLASLSGGQYISLGLMFERTFVEPSFNLSESDGVVRYLDTIGLTKRKESTVGLRVKYYPAKNISAWVSYINDEKDRSFDHSHSYSLGGAYEFEMGIRASFDFSRIENLDLTLPGIEKYQVVNFSLGYRF